MQQPSDLNRNLRKGGFTILELMVAIMVFTIIGSVLTMVVTTGINFYSEENSQIDNQLDLTEFSFMVDSDIRKTNSLSSSANCFILNRLSGNVSYCFTASTQSITRNGTLITDRVSSMTFTLDGSSLDILIQSIPDHRGDVNLYRQHYTLREGNY